MSLAKRVVNACTVIPMISKLEIGFCPFIGKPSAGTIEFLRRITSKKAQVINPKCEITPIVLNPYSQPYINVSFINGESRRIESAGVDVRDIFLDIDTTCFNIEWEEDMQLANKFAAEQQK